MNTFVLKNRGFRAFAGIVLALFMALSMLAPVQAASVRTLNAGTTASYARLTNEDVFYKVTLPSDGLVTVIKQHDASVAIYAKADKKSTQYAYMYPSESRETFALAKGTYYFRANNSYKKMSNGKYYYYHKFKYTFKAVKPGTNYNISRAVSLKAGVTTNVIQTRLNYYPRWYKITLTRTQKINYWSNNCGYIEVYDNSFDRLETYKVADGRYATKSKQTAGVYYIRVNPVSSSLVRSHTAHRTTLRWK